MKVLRPCLGGLLAAAAFLVPQQSDAASVRAGLGASYWLDQQSALFDFTLGVEGHITGPITAGARFGVALITEGNDLAIPLDLTVRANLTSAPIYLEGMVGPWIVLGRGDALRVHAAFGFGFQRREFSIGLEAGYLDPSPIIGVKLGYRF
jgi:hypothetical protein